MTSKIRTLAFLVVFSIFIPPIIFGQTEFISRIDPTSGAFTKIDSIPGLKWIYFSYTTFDKGNHRYIFKGGDAFGNLSLYSIDVTTGNVVYSPTFPQLSSQGEFLNELHFDNVLNTIFGMLWYEGDSSYYIGSIDPISGAISRIHTLPNINGISFQTSVYDQNNHRYIFAGMGNGVTNLYSVDVTTGSVIANPSFPQLADPGDNISLLQYDNFSDNLFGLYWDGSENKYYLASVAPNSGAISKIDSLPGVSSINTFTSHVAFDQVNRRYIFRGGDVNGNWYLYSVDVNTGAIVSNPSFPITSDPLDNIIEIQFDNSSLNLYALHWDNSLVVGIDNPHANHRKFDLFPNPTAGYTTVTLDKVYRDITVFVYNSSGSMILKENDTNTSSISIHLGGQSHGTYYVSVICDHKMHGVKKICLE